ncbi:MAG TPA: acyl carrier protein [Xanthobacteraceae bacterium]|nr:acyl carrier protein [Xanthobacteraceae bacterium]
MQTDIAAQIRAFIADNFLFREDRTALADDESLLEAGLVDSTGVLELVAFLEERFNIQMADAEIVPENLDSVRAISDYVTRKLREALAA